MKTLERQGHVERADEADAGLEPRSCRLFACRECSDKVSAQAVRCPHCGAPYPVKPEWDGWG